MIRQEMPRDPWIQGLRWATAFVYLTMGAGLLLGPTAWRSSPSFTIISWWVPGGMRTWGAVYLAIGVLFSWALLGRHPGLLRVMFIVGSSTIAACAVSFATGALVGKVVGATGPPMWAFFSATQVVQAGRIHRNQ